MGSNSAAAKKVNFLKCEKSGLNSEIFQRRVAILNRAGRIDPVNSNLSSTQHALQLIIRKEAGGRNGFA
jgi:hypothetical protein